MSPRLREPLAPLGGIAVVEAPALHQDAPPLLIRWPMRGTPTLVVGTRPLTPLEQAGRDAQLAVREGLADVLAWLGEPVDRWTTRARVEALLRRTKS